MDSNAKAKNLVIYFSMPQTTDLNNMSREEELSTVVIDGKVLGNTQYVAYVIEQNTGADVITNGLSISRNVVQDSEQDIIKWLTDKGFIQ